MSERYSVVKGWEDIDRFGEPSDKDKLAIVRAFTEASFEFAAWVPEWLLEEKDIKPVSGSENIVVGMLDGHSEKAWRVWQSHRARTSDGVVLEDPNDYLPKSEVYVFERLNPEIEIEPPQSGLSQYGGES